MPRQVFRIGNMTGEIWTDEQDDRPHRHDSRRRRRRRRRDSEYRRHEDMSDSSNSFDDEPCARRPTFSDLFRRDNIADASPYIPEGIFSSVELRQFHGPYK